jgi:hypothetical protein
VCLLYVFPPVRKKSQQDCIIELFTYDSRGVYSRGVSRKLPIYRLLTHSLTRSLLSFFYYSILHMDFFGLGSATEMETPLGLLVKSATDPLLLGPDWAKNLEICDSISSLPEA